MQRRQFISLSAAALPFAARGQKTTPARTSPEDLFKISLAQWSNHRMLGSKKLTTLDWPAYVQKNYDIHALEYVNSFFKDKAQDQTYLTELKTRVADLNLTNVLIMVDGEGHIGAESEKERQTTVDNHKKWVEAAKFLGCHSIRVNSFGEGPSDDAKAANCIKGLHALATFAQDYKINVIVENHGGLSSNGAWMAKVLKEVNLDNCGSLPDFGNFYDYDRYQGIDDLMPFAKGVSAKSHEFDQAGNETKTDYLKALEIVLKHGYHGYVGVEYEGKILSEDDGVIATKKLLEKTRTQLAEKA